MLNPEQINRMNQLTPTPGNGNAAPTQDLSSDDAYNQWKASLNVPTQGSQNPQGSQDPQGSQNPQGSQDPQGGGFFSGVGDFAKSLASIPLTYAARPVQAVAEGLFQQPSDSVDKVTSALTGGLVAPVPQNFGDVEKDVGRGVQGGAAIMSLENPIAGNALFGLGNSLKEGNDLFSGQTLFQTVLGGATGKVLSLLGQPIMNVAGKIIGKVTLDYLSDVASQGTKAIVDFAAAHDILPDIVSKGINNAGTAVNTALNTGESAVNDAASGVKNYVKGGINNLKNKVVTPPPNDLEIINDMISPKPTPSVVKLAMDQDRLFPATKGGIVSEGNPGQIATSEEQANSVRTIQRLIPDAATLDPGTLGSEVKYQMKNISRTLKPELEKVPITPETIQKITDDWQATKLAQNESPFSPKDGTVKSFQKDFEKRLQNSKSGNMNDLWETAIGYDNSIPNAVKNATDLSPHAMQSQRNMWLQNRKIIRDPLKDYENALGPTARQAFSDLRDLNVAQKGLMSRAEIQPAPPSVATKFLDTKTGKVVKYGGLMLGSGGLYKLGEDLTH